MMLETGMAAIAHNITVVQKNTIQYMNIKIEESDYNAHIRYNRTRSVIVR